MELLVRPRSDFLLQASLDGLHQASKVWISELEFWRDEHKFMMDLIGKYFLKMSVFKRLQHGQGLVYKIELSDDRSKEFLRATIKHEAHLAELMDNPFEQDEQKFREEHRKLEQGITDFMKDFKTLKKEMFNLIEEIIRDDKSSHQLSK